MVKGIAGAQHAELVENVVVACEAVPTHRKRAVLGQLVVGEAARRGEGAGERCKESVFREAHLVEMGNRWQGRSRCVLLESPPKAECAAGVIGDGFAS
jgi:hypothetical protein